MGLPDADQSEESGLLWRRGSKRPELIFLASVRGSTGLRDVQCEINNVLKIVCHSKWVSRIKIWSHKLAYYIPFITVFACFGEV